MAKKKAKKKGKRRMGKKGSGWAAGTKELIFNRDEIKVVKT